MLLMNAPCETHLSAVLLACCVTLAAANLNMFVDRAEVHRITGVHGSGIHYIQDGVINQYATGYVVPVGANISVLRLHWQSLVRRPMPYEISFRWNDPEAMSEPRANISYVGYVPRVETVFSVLFPCTGRVSAVVEVDIMFNITIYQPKQRIAFLKLKRRKTCLQGHPTHGLSASANATSRREQSAAGGGRRQHDFSLVLGIAGAIAVTFVTLGTVMLFVLRQRKAALSSSFPESASIDSRAFAKNISKSYHSIDKMARSCSYATIASLKKLPRLHSAVVTSLHADVSRPVTSLAGGGAMTSQHYASSEIGARASCGEGRPDPGCPPLDLRDVALSQLDRRDLTLSQLDRRDLTLSQLLAEGAVGRLYRGTLGSRPCLVKTLSGAPAGSQQQQQQQQQQHASRLLTDAGLLLGCCHPALLVPLGCCPAEQQDGVPPCVLYPDLGTTDLKRFLGACRLEGPAAAAAAAAGGTGGDGRVLRQQNMVDMTVQLLSGLVHLHSRGIVHRDVAARNCVVDDRLRVRLTDAALSSDLYPAEYACLSDGACRPIRWAAPESLLRERHSPASDVWAAAVTAWEVTSLGQLPFSELREPLEVLVLLREGYRLARPAACPTQMYSALLSCWAMDPERRPQATDLLAWVQDLSRSFDRLI